MEFLQLKYFSHAAKTENFSHTAQNFMVPASCISASIKKLETEIGVKLFDRTANKIKLNEYGKILLTAVNQTEELFKKAKADIFDLSQTPAGELKLLVLANRQKVTDVISDFKIKYPYVSFSIKHQWQNKQQNIKGYDIIVTDENILSDFFDRKFWLCEEIFLAVHKGNPLSKKTNISTNEIKNEKLICLPKGNSLRDCVDMFFEKKELIPNITIECDDIQYIWNYLKMGLGVTFFPSISWKEQIVDDVALLHIDSGLYRNSYIYTNKSSSAIAHLFSQMLEMNI